MRRAYWTADFAEAHVVQAMLRSQRIEAWVFDADMARQDWFRVLAIGGYRVMVTAADAPRAAEMIGEYRAGAFAVADDAVERPACPRCAAPGSPDPAPHRLVFALLIAVDVLFVAWLMLATIRSDDIITLIVFLGSVGLVPAIVIAFTHHLKSRYVCQQCATRWRSRPAPFSVMTREVDAAANIDGVANVESPP
jgi:hypothetical protein